MKKIVVEFYRTALPLLILLVGVLGCFALYEMRSIPAEKTPEKAEAPVVETMPIRKNSGGFDIVASGEVVPYREIQVSAEVCGRIITDNIRSGFFVEKGSLLLEIDPTNFRLDARRYKEEVKQAGIQLDENSVETKNLERLIELTKQDLQLQKKDCDRMASLRQSHAVSESEFDAAKRNVLAAEIALAQLENQSNLLQQKRISLESAKEKSQILADLAEEDLLRTKIFAPCDGMILRDDTEPGNYVSVGQSLFYLEDVSKVEVRCQLQTKDIYWLWAQQNTDEADQLPKQFRYGMPEVPAKISYSIEGRTFSWNGILKRFDGHGLNASTRTAPVLIEVSHPEQVASVGQAESEKMFAPPALARGHFVSVSIHVDPEVMLWRIPTVAVRPGNKIFMTSGKRLEIHDIQVVQRNGNETVFRPLSGKLNPADLLVISPIGSVEQGMTVRVQKRTAVAENHNIVQK